MMMAMMYGSSNLGPKRSSLIDKQPQYKGSTPYNLKNSNKMTGGLPSSRITAVGSNDLSPHPHAPMHANIVEALGLSSTSKRQQKYKEVEEVDDLDNCFSSKLTRHNVERNSSAIASKQKTLQ